MIEFATDAATVELVSRVADRAGDLGMITANYDRMTCVMDLQATAASCDPPLDLRALVEDFDNSNFIHDIAGIARHINRNTGTLEDYFLPRCARF